jgi:hypothetical protein
LGSQRPQAGAKVTSISQAKATVLAS